jgi:hypothetical protein
MFQTNGEEEEVAVATGALVGETLDERYQCTFGRSRREEGSYESSRHSPGKEVVIKEKKKEACGK